MRLIVFLALRQLWARRLLSGIALFAVSLGILVLIVMSGIMLGFRQQFLSNILKISPQLTLFDRQLRTQPPILYRLFGDEAKLVGRVAHQLPGDRDARIPRPSELATALRRLPGVVAAAQSLSGSAVLTLGAKELPVEVRGVEPAPQELVTPLSQFIIAGRLPAFMASKEAIVVGDRVAEKIGAHVGDHVLLAGRGGARTLEVVALFRSDIPTVDSARVYIQLPTAQALFARPGVVGRIEARLDDPANAPEVARRLEQLSGYDAESWQETNANFLGLFEIQNRIVGFVIGAIMLTGGFGILAIQIMFVLQKTRDISILRSVGFQRRDILAVFLLQGAIVGLLGGLVGDGIGWGLCRLLATVKVKMDGLVRADSFLVADTPSLYALAILFAVTVGVVASALPAWRASRVEPVDVLRGQIS